LKNKKWEVSIKNWEAVHGRILKLYMNMWCYKLTVIGIYAANEDNEVTVKDELFAKFSKEIVKSYSARKLILIGDVNRRTGRKIRDGVVGNFEKTWLGATV
jgi:exonuclease III